MLDMLFSQNSSAQEYLVAAVLQLSAEGNLGSGFAGTFTKTMFTWIFVSGLIDCFAADLRSAAPANQSNAFNCFDVASDKSGEHSKLYTLPWTDIGFRLFVSVANFRCALPRLRPDSL